MKHNEPCNMLCQWLGVKRMTAADRCWSLLPDPLQNKVWGQGQSQGCHALWHKRPHGCCWSKQRGRQVKCSFADSWGKHRAMNWLKQTKSLDSKSSIQQLIVSFNKASRQQKQAYLISHFQPRLGAANAWWWFLSPEFVVICNCSELGRKKQAPKKSHPVVCLDCL